MSPLLLEPLALVVLLVVPTGFFVSLGAPPPPPRLKEAGGPCGSGATELASAARSLAAGEGPAVGHGPSKVMPDNQESLACATRTRGVQPATNSARWSEIGAAPPSSGWIAYDSADREAVVVGPINGPYNVPQVGTWTYAGSTWSFENTSSAPPYCGGATVAYDSTDHYVLYVGGANCTGGGETWSFSAGTWTQMTSAKAPLRDDAVLSDDPADGYVIQFGGFNQSCGYCNTTWAYRAGTWTDVTPSSGPSPPPMSQAAAAYDPTDHEVVLFDSRTNDTWAYSSGSWTNVTHPLAPPPRESAAMATDPFTGGVLLTGGDRYPPGTVQNDTWSFLNGTWTKLVGHGPTPAVELTTAADLNRTPGELLALGGGEVWAFNGTAWANNTPGVEPLAVFAEPQMVYDSADGYVLTMITNVPETSNLDQVFQTDFWEYRAGIWTNITQTNQPSARLSVGLAYDAADGYVLLFGGSGWLYDPVTCGSHTTAQNLCGDTWEFLNGNWSEITPSTSPSNRSGEAMTYDGADGYVLMTGGTCYARSYTRGCNDTWAYARGTWTNLTGTAGAGPDDAEPQMVYDAADLEVILFERFVYHPPWLVNETWAFKGGTWTNLTSVTRNAPSPPNGASMVYDSEDGYVLLFSSVIGVGPGLAGYFYDDTWSYLNGTWTNVTVQPEPQVAHGSLVDDPSDGYTLMFGMGLSCSPPCSPGPGGKNPYFEWTTGKTPITIASFAASPPATDVGVGTTLAVRTTGGAQPLTYSYPALPPGCITANQSSLPCTPTLGGAFLTRVVVTDAAGNRTSADLSLLVHASPTVSAFLVAPSPVPIGQRTILTTSISGGTAPWTYTYAGLPPGCTSQDVPALPCVPSAAGNYTLAVTVADGVNASTAAAVSFSVTSIGSGSLRLDGFGASPSALVLGNATNFSTTARTGSPPLTYAYSGLPSGCSSSNSSAIGCRPTSAGTYSVIATVTDSAGNFVQANTTLAVYPVGGGGSLVIAAYAVTPTTPIVGALLVLSVSAAGGEGTLTFNYSDLPAGCLTADSARLSCTPAAAGKFVVEIAVSDSMGNRAAIGIPLVVASTDGPNAGPPLQVGSFTASPATVPVGQLVTFDVTVSGGIAPYAFAFDGLMPGCTSTDQPEWGCRPASVGSYVILVVVHDASGANASAELEVSVTSSTGSPGLAGPDISSATPWLLQLVAVAAAGGLIGGAAVWFGTARRKDRGT